MLTFASFELGMRRYNDAMMLVTERDKHLLRNHEKACADAIEALAKGQLQYAKDIIDKYLAQEAE